MKSIITGICCFLLLQGCASDKQDTTTSSKMAKIDSFESAMPHGQSLANTELSDEDKVKLARAKGRKAEIISFDTLQQIVEQDTSGLVIYKFWNNDCQSCKRTIEALQKLQPNYFEKDAFKVIYINIDGLYPEMVNSFIREQQIVDQVYTISMDTVTNWASYFQPNWDGELPALMISNKDDGIQLFYQKEFSLEELQALLLPLSM